MTSREFLVSSRILFSFSSLFRMSTSESRRIEVLTGLFVFCGLLLLAGLILQFSSIKEAFRADYPIQVKFSDSEGLAKNSPVRYGGTRIGRVERLEAQLKEQDGIMVTVGQLVHLKVYQEFNIPQGAQISVGKEGLLGDSFVKITAPAPPIIGVLKPGDTIEGRTSGGLDALQEAANDVANETQKLLKQIRLSLVDLSSAISKLDRDILSEQNLTNLRESIQSLTQTLKKADQEVLSPENVAHLKQTLAQLDAASGHVALGSARLDSLMAKGEKAVDNFGLAATTFKESGSAFKKAAEATGKTVGEINYGSGLFNALIHDAELRNDFTALIANLKERGILFYKDTSDTRPAPIQPPLAPSRPGAKKP
jgi:phospholipid/cholesterol/gamma-HCH transport system substrate-binding protein